MNSHGEPSHHQDITLLFWREIVVATVLMKAKVANIYCNTLIGIAIAFDCRPIPGLPDGPNASRGPQREFSTGAPPSKKAARIGLWWASSWSWAAEGPIWERRAGKSPRRTLTLCITALSRSENCPRRHEMCSLHASAGLSTPGTSFARKSWS